MPVHLKEVLFLGVHVVPFFYFTSTLHVKDHGHVAPVIPWKLRQGKIRSWRSMMMACEIDLFMVDPVPFIH